MPKTFEEYFGGYLQILEEQRDKIFEAEDATGLSNQSNTDFNECNRHVIKHLCDLYKRTRSQDSQAQESDQEIVFHMRDRGVNSWEFLVGARMKQQRVYLRSIKRVLIPVEAIRKYEEASKFFKRGRHERSVDHDKAIGYFKKAMECLDESRTASSSKNIRELKEYRIKKWGLVVAALGLVFLILKFVYENFIKIGKAG